jgi:hypothetical protein
MFKNGNSFKGRYLDNTDSLSGNLSFANGTKFRGLIRKDGKYEGKLFIGDDWIRGNFDSDLNLENDKVSTFTIDNYNYMLMGDSLSIPGDMYQNFSEQQMEKLKKQLTHKFLTHKTLNYKKLKDFADKMKDELKRKKQEQQLMKRKKQQQQLMKRKKQQQQQQQLKRKIPDPIDNGEIQTSQF